MMVQERPFIHRDTIYENGYNREIYEYGNVILGLSIERDPIVHGGLMRVLSCSV